MEINQKQFWRNINTIILAFPFLMKSCSVDSIHPPQELLPSPSTITIARPSFNLPGNWQKEGKSRELKSPSVTDNEVVWGISRDTFILNNNEGVYKTLDNGEHWKKIEVAQTIGINHLGMINTDSGIGVLKPLANTKGAVLTNITKITYSIDQGKSWITRKLSTALAQGGITASSKNQMWAWGERLYFSSDRGVKWIDVFDNLKRNFPQRNYDTHQYIKSFLDVGYRVICLTTDGNIYSSANLGASWERHAPPSIPPIGFMENVRMITDKDNNLWIAFNTDSREGIYSGIQKINNENQISLPNMNVKDVIFLSNGKIVICGSLSPFALHLSLKTDRLGFIMVSPDLGKNWQVEYLNPDVSSINSISVVGSTVFGVGDKGIVVKLSF